MARVFGFTRRLAAAAIVAASTATAAEPAYDSGGTSTSARRLFDASRAAYHGRYTEALALDGKALAITPNFGRALQVRSLHYTEIGRYADAMADLDRVLAMHPDDMGLAMQRVEILIFMGEPARALVEMGNALKLPLFVEWHAPYEAGPFNSGYGDRYGVTGHMESLADLYGSIAMQMQHRDLASLDYLHRMLQLEVFHPEHFLSYYCFAAGRAGLAESAALMCDEAISDNPHDIGQYDSLGFARLRAKQWDKAIVAYDKALDNRPDLTLSLYGRGIAKRAKGDTTGGNADIAAATKTEPDIANIMKRIGAPVI
jgi:tetratricopeptide (TPR) repeat protein